MTKDEELERLARAATPGPWAQEEYRSPQAKVFNVVGDGLLISRVHEGNPKRAFENAAFIAAANPATILALLSANREMRVALERIADPRNIHFAGDAQVVARSALTTQRGG